MPNNNQETRRPDSQASKLIIGLLSTSIVFAAAALLGVWKQSDLTEQRLSAIDDKHLTARNTLDAKYIEKSGRVIKRVDAIAQSLAAHFKDDNAHQLLIQREHLVFGGFMEKLEDAHVDIEDLKQRCDIQERFGCKNTTER